MQPFLNEKPKHQNITNTKYSPCLNFPQKSTPYNWKCLSVT